MRRRPSDKITSLGEDYREWPKEWWGEKDLERERARLAAAARKPTPREFQPLPAGPPVNLAINSLHPPLPSTRDLDRRLAALGVGKREPDVIDAWFGIRPRA